MSHQICSLRGWDNALQAPRLLDWACLTPSNWYPAGLADMGVRRVKTFWCSPAGALRCSVCVFVCVCLCPQVQLLPSVLCHPRGVQPAEGNGCAGTGAQGTGGILCLSLAQCAGRLLRT